jgi:hypothetical protein
VEQVKKIEEIIRNKEPIDFSSGNTPAFGNLSDLFFRPTLFFKSQIAIGKLPYLFFITWIVGISGAMDRIDKQLLKASAGNSAALETFMGKIVDSWTAFWIFVMLMGAVSGYFLWLFGGWWYNTRLKICGVVNHDKKNGRIVYIYTSFVYALPCVLTSIIQTFLYANYRDAYNSDSLLTMLLLVFPFWAVINSYKAVNTVFETKKGKAKLWFLILPIIVYILVFGVVAALFAIIGMNNV